jgi:cell wall-associated NlpC family hydrolase
MKPTILIIFLLVINNSFSQTKWAKKAEQFYRAKKYEKCLAKSKKYLKKTPKSAELQFYISASYYGLYLQNENINRKSLYLKKGLKAWKKYSKYGGDSYELDSLSYACLSNFVKQQSTSKKYDAFHEYLAMYFNDTTAFFRQNIQKNQSSNQSDIVEEILNDTIQWIIDKAETLIGTPYKYGGTDTSGFDCSGFTQYVYKSVGIDLPHNANMQFKLGKKVEIENAKAGDLIFFGKSRAYHAAMIYKSQNGDIELIHCVSGGVQHQAKNDTNTIYWLERPYTIKRLVAKE